MLFDTLFKMYTLISHIADHAGKETTLAGWVYNFRSSGSIFFLQLRDGSGRVQCVISKKDVSEAVWAACQSLTIESSVVVTGLVNKDKRAQGGYEVKANAIQLLAKAEEFPIGKKEHGPEFLMDNRHLWLRSSKQEAILRVRSEIVFAIQEYMRSQDFVLTHTPTFTPNPCEGTTDLFEVQYFDEKAYLTQNGQLYLEALAMALGRVYDLNQNFRAEKSKTRRHLTEFWSVNPEAAFMTHEESMRMQEGLVVAIVKAVLERCKKEFSILERDTKKLEPVAEGTFPRLTYHEAVAQLAKLGSDMKVGEDFGADDETLLTNQYDRPIFVERWPKEIKPFYMKKDPANPALVLNNDLLAPEGYGEIIGGSQREDDFETLRAAILAHKLKMADFEWYLDLRRYGSVPHSGFGLGIERAVTWICGLHHVREAIPFARMLNRIRP